MLTSSAALRNLRSCVILLVVGFHSVLPYLASQHASQAPFNSPPYSWLGVPLVDNERWLGFDLFCAAQYVFLMPFMFFLSGLFVWPTLVRKGSWVFLSERVLRLGVPFVLGVYLLMPIAHYPVYRVTAVDPSWSAFWAQWVALPFWPSGPLWFLWQLLVLDVAAAALYCLAPQSGAFLGRLGAGDSPHRFFLLLLTISALAYVPFALKFQPWDWGKVGPFSFQPSRLLHYLVYFFAGVGVGAYGLDRGLLRLDGMLARRWALWLAAAVAAFIVWMAATAVTMGGASSQLPQLEVLPALAFTLSSATACLCFASVFLRFASRPWPAFAGLSENAYGIYLVHYVFVIWLQYLLLGLALFAIVKGALVFAGALSLSLASAVAIRHIPIGARLLGAQRAASARTPRSDLAKTV
jgi:peptidoglycan/LPS O-acetylase OafA/YrhL